SRSSVRLRRSSPPHSKSKVRSRSSSSRRRRSTGRRCLKNSALESPRSGLMVGDALRRVHRATIKSGMSRRPEARAGRLERENRRLAHVVGVALCGASLAASSTAECAASPLDETARFLAGKAVAPDSKLAKFAQAQFYAEHAEQIGSGWRRFQQPNLE